MKKLFMLLAVALLLFSIAACGGSSSSDDDSNTESVTVTGVFQDAVVQGLKYNCAPSGKTGITNELGEYTCNEGDTVEFFIGGYSLGKTTATEGIITPMSLYPDDEVAATDILQLLQSLDNASDGTIVIPEDFTALDNMTAMPGSDEFESTVSDVLADLGKELVSEDDAMSHFISNLLANKTFYEVEEGETFLNKIVINSDLTSVHVTVLIAGSGDGDAGDESDVDLSLDNETFNLTLSGTDEEGDWSSVLTIEEVTNNYISFDYVDDDGATGVMRFYFSEDNARAYLNQDSPAVTFSASLLADKTFYEVEEGETFLNKIAINSDVTSVHVTVLIAGSGDGDAGDEGDVDLSLDVDNAKLTLSGTDEEGDWSSTLTFKETTDYYMSFSFVDDDGTTGVMRFYFSEADARAYLGL